MPARVLLKAIEEHGLPNDQSKEADYYVGLRDATEKDTVPVSLCQMDANDLCSYELKLRMHRIIAGDPSRGSIAVEDVAAPPVGSLVEVRQIMPTRPSYVAHRSSVVLLQTKECH